MPAWPISASSFPRSSAPAGGQAPPHPPHSRPPPRRRVLSPSWPPPPAALVAAGAGIPVAKHGNRAASSRCGSADVLEALGVDITLNAGGVRRCIEVAGMGFCFAPTFHPAMRHAGPARKELGVRTIFNVLGPLANPGRVRRQALGVGAAPLAPLMVRGLKDLGPERALPFSAHAGPTRLTTTGRSRVFQLKDGQVTEAQLGPPEPRPSRALPAGLL